MLRTTPGKVLLSGLLALLMSISQAHTASASIGVWTSNGPEGGYITALAIDPQTPTTLYAGTWGGGVFGIQQMQKIYLPLILRNG